MVVRSERYDMRVRCDVADGSAEELREKLGAEGLTLHFFGPLIGGSGHQAEISGYSRSVYRWLRENGYREDDASWKYLSDNVYVLEDDTCFEILIPEPRFPTPPRGFLEWFWSADGIEAREEALPDAFSPAMMDGDGCRCGWFLDHIADELRCIHVGTPERAIYGGGIIPAVPGRPDLVPIEWVRWAESAARSGGPTAMLVGQAYMGSS